MKMAVKEEIKKNEIESIYTLALVDTNNEDVDIHINDYLIENGFASFDEKETMELRDKMSTIRSPDANCTIPVSSPSPLPTCAFPLSASNALAQQLENGSPYPVLNGIRLHSPVSPGRYIQNGQASSIVFPEDSDAISRKFQTLSISSSEHER